MPLHSWQKVGEVVYRGIASKLFLSDSHMEGLNWVRKGGEELFLGEI